MLITDQVDLRSKSTISISTMSPCMRGSGFESRSSYEKFELKAMTVVCTFRPTRRSIQPPGCLVVELFTAMEQSRRHDNSTYVHDLFAWFPIHIVSANPENVAAKVRYCVILRESVSSKLY